MIRLESTPRSIASLTRGGMASTATRSRAAGCRSRRRIPGGKSPRGNGPSPAAAAASALVPLMEEFGPDVVVSDILTAAPALAAEKAGRRRATLIPHVYPVHQPGMPFFSFGAQPPRTPLGKAMWRAWLPVLTSGLRPGRREVNGARAGGE